jgi:hypothetical protein
VLTPKTQNNFQGKSTLIGRLLEENRNFEEPFDSVVWCYDKHGCNEDLMNQLKDKFPLTCVAGVPTQAIKENTLFPKDAQSKLIVIDDCFYELKNSSEILRLWGVLSHHQKITVILVGFFLH